MSVVTDKVVFLQVQKTGSTFITKAMLDSSIDAHEEGGKHRRFPGLNGRMLMASIRNPWDWYVSLWAFGCMGRGLIQHRLTVRKRGNHGEGAPLTDRAKFMAVQAVKPVRRFRELYQDAERPENFRRWIRALYGRRARWALAERYAASPVARYAGFYTWRYLYLLSRDLEDLFDPALADPARLRQYLKEGLQPHHLIRTESLGEDAVKGLIAAGHQLTPEDEALFMGRGKNRSGRSRELSDYYDDETLAFVADRERVMIEHLGYQVPTLS